jgi:hypothetical protein
LIVDIPKRQVNKKRSKQTIGNIVRVLKRLAAANQLPDGTLIFGWPGGSKPANAVDTDNDAVMAAWAARSVVIGLRCSESFGDEIPIDKRRDKSDDGDAAIGQRELRTNVLEFCPTFESEEDISMIVLSYILAFIAPPAW